MEDYVKFKLDPNKYWDLFYNKEKYHLESVTDMTDGLEKFIQGSHRNLKLHLSRSQIIVSGSLHKFYNDMMGKGNQN